jgi:hypothetical protein
MNQTSKKILLVPALAIIVLIAWYFINRSIYIQASKTAFPNLPIDTTCYYFPWPIGPELIGQLDPEDPVYLNRDVVERFSENLELIIYDSSGNFSIRPK